MKITIITAVFNGEKYLEEAIKSVLCQNYENFEYIIVNDGSNDSTKEIIEKYSKKDNRIVPIYHNNSGHVISYNRGILNSTGEYLLFLDSDDSLSNSNSLGQLVSKMSRDVDVVYGLFGEERSPSLNDGIYLSDIFLERQLSDRNYISYTRAKLIKKDLFYQIGLFDNFICDDEEWIIRLYTNMKFNLYLFGKKVCDRRIHNESITRAQNKESLYKKSLHRILVVNKNFSAKPLNLNILQYQASLYLSGISFARSLSYMQILEILKYVNPEVFLSSQSISKKVLYIFFKFTPRLFQAILIKSAKYI